MELQNNLKSTFNEPLNYKQVGENNCIIWRDNKGSLLEVYPDFTNKRLKVLNYRLQEWPQALSWLDDTANQNHLGKILFNIRRSDNHLPKHSGYVLEGIIPGFFQGEDALCFSRFTAPARSKSKYIEQEDMLLDKIKSKPPRPEIKKLPAGLTIEQIGPEHVDTLVDLYRKIFTSYPSPLLHPDYVRKVMQTHVNFWGVFEGGKLVSAAAAEMNPIYRNAEITDCATLPENRGQGLLSRLIGILEQEMLTRKIGSLYSLARAGSYGMNAALYRLGYDYRGRFINNCHIGGRFEDMNLWVKTVPTVKSSAVLH